MTRPFSDWGGNLIAFAIVVTVNALSNRLPINGQTMAEISAKYPTLFTPAGVTFAIWGVIYLGLLVFVIYQALPAQRADERCASVSKPFQFNCIANASWMIAWHYDLLIVSLLLMLAILASLILIYRKLTPEDSPIVAVPFRIYTAWICVATIANLSVVQYAYGLDNLGLNVIDWTLLKIAFAGAIGAIAVIRNSDPWFGVVVAWAAYGIAVKQAATPAVAGAAQAAMYAVILLIVYSLVARRTTTNKE